MKFIFAVAVVFGLVAPCVFADAEVDCSKLVNGGDKYVACAKLKGKSLEDCKVKIDAKVPTKGNSTL